MRGRRWIVGLLASLVVWGCTAGVGYAAVPAVSDPVVVAQGVGWYSWLTLDPAGEATVAWSGQRMGDYGFYVPHGLFATRGPREGPFGAPQEVWGDDFSEAVLVQNLLGDRALVWTPLYAGDPHVAFAPRREDFGAPEVVPGGFRSRPDVALTNNGELAVGYLEGYGDTRDAVVRIRAKDGTWSPPQVLGSRAEHISLAADGLGRFHAMWSAWPPDQPTENGTVMHASDADADGQFGPDVVISAPGHTADTGLGDPSLQADAAGDLLAIWTGGVAPFSTSGSPEATTAFRPAGGDWLPPTVFGGYWSTAALGPTGDAAIAWSGPHAPSAAFRSIATGWGEPSTAASTPVNYERSAIGVDARGNAIVASRLVGGNPTSAGTSGSYVGLYLLQAGGTLGDVVAASPIDQGTSVPQLAVDAEGRGLVLWAQGENDSETLYVRLFTLPLPEPPAPPPDPAPEPPRVVAGVPKRPSISAFHVRRHAFTFRLNKAAAVSVKAIGGHQRAHQSARARLGLNRLAFSSRMRAVLRRPGRYRITIHARGGNDAVRHLVTKR